MQGKHSGLWPCTFGLIWLQMTYADMYPFFESEEAK
jgi:hypothetical protein